MQFNSILYYLCAESTAKRPITDTAQSKCRHLHYRKKIIVIKIIINFINLVKIFHSEWKNKISIFTINKIIVIHFNSILYYISAESANYKHRPVYI
jgi:hypothetical protein